ncbi:MAG TPA: LysR family transcriptional regulator [Mycobacteriales bacterium]|nr:LysR family transcriptional regulator [Mycobacteriales bacterium]
MRTGFEYRLDWIVSFVAVAEHQGFSAAAAALYRSQPRVSVQVAELENALGVRLFDRSTHPAKLTAQGRELLPHAQAMLGSLQSMCSTASHSDGVPRGEVRVGMYPSAAAFLLPRLLKMLRKLYPEITFTLYEGTSLDLEAALLDGRIELAIRPLMPAVRSERLTHSLLWREPLVAVVEDEHPLAAQRSTCIGDLAELPLITIGESNAVDQPQFETTAAFSQSGMTPRIVLQTNQPQTLTALVRSGLGVGITNSMAMAVSKLDGVCTLPIRDARCERQVGVWWHADRPETAAQRTVREIMSAVPTPRWDRRGTTRTAVRAEPERIAG